MMAATDDLQFQVRDVSFARTTSTKNWGRAAKNNFISGYPSIFMGDTPRVIRTGGITGTLPSHSFHPSNSNVPISPDPTPITDFLQVPLPNTSPSQPTQNVEQQQQQTETIGQPEGKRIQLYCSHVK